MHIDNFDNLSHMVTLHSLFTIHTVVNENIFANFCFLIFLWPSTYSVSCPNKKLQL